MCSKITSYCFPKTQIEVHLNGILHYFCMGICLVEQQRLDVVVQGSFTDTPSLQQFAGGWGGSAWPRHSQALLCHFGKEGLDWHSRVPGQSCACTGPSCVLLRVKQ